MLPEYEAMRRVPVSRFRRELMSIIRRKECVVITRKGVDISVLLPIHMYEEAKRAIGE